MTDAIVASIGTTHPWNVAGIGLDARVAAEYGVRHVAAVAGISAQDDKRVRAVLPVPGRILRAQLESLPVSVAAFRIGALVSSENIGVVADFLAVTNASMVIDPVLAATSGEALWTTAAYIDDMRRRLLPLPALVTPNLEEAALLLRSKPVRDEAAMRQAAGQFVEIGACAALIKGGHLRDEPMDVLATQERIESFRSERIAGEMRGTGCVLAASLACELALGTALFEAVVHARQYVRAKIQAGTHFGALQTAF